MISGKYLLYLRKGTVCALVFGVLLTACSHNQSSEDPWHRQMETDRRTLTSSFERSVYRDDKISRAEYVEAVDRYVKCVDVHGIALTAVPDASGMFQYKFPGRISSEFDALSRSCAQGTTAVIEKRYIEMLQNPKHLDRYAAIASCLTSRHAVAGSLSGPELKQVLVQSKNLDAITRPFNGRDATVQSCFASPYN